MQQDLQPDPLSPQQVTGLLRYVNLRLLIERESKGSVTAFAARHGLNRASLARVASRKHIPDDKIGEDMAAKIEEVAGLELGWLSRFWDERPKDLCSDAAKLLDNILPQLQIEGLKRQLSGTLPILRMQDAGSLLGGRLLANMEPQGYLMAPLPSGKGDYFLAVDTDNYSDYLPKGMLAQIMAGRLPTAEEAYFDPILVLVKWPEDALPTFLIARSYGDLLTYGPVSPTDDVKYSTLDGWQVGGMVVSTVKINLKSATMER